MNLLSHAYQPDHDISSGQRLLKTDGAKYDFLFPSSDGRDRITVEDGEVTDTIKMIERVVWTYINDTKKLAELLKQDSTAKTLEAIWEFLYHNIQYQLDKPGLEQLRRPARAWADRASGIDCDCFSIFCSSILTNMGIPHKFRITRYSQPHWQHIYVIVHKEGTAKDYWTVDAVLGKFNYEKPFSQKMDYTMNLNGINVAVLSGVEDISPAAVDNGRIVMNSMQLAAANNVALHAAIFGVDLQGLGILAGDFNLSGDITDTAIENGLHRYLIATRQAIAENPATAYVAGYNQQEIIKMLDYALHYWFTDKREAALGQLIANEALLNQINGFGNLEGLLSDDDLYGDDDILTGLFEEEGLGKAKSKKPKQPKKKKKGFFKKIGEGLKKVGKGIMRFNPATIAARNGLLLALKLNVGKMSTRLKWGYATPEQAKAKGISTATVTKSKKAIEKIEKIFTKIGGKANNLKKAILSGKKGKLNGMEGLGQLGILPAAAIAAATPLITAVIKIIKESGLAKKDENIDISQTEGDAVSDEGVTFDDADAGTDSGSDAGSTELTVTDMGESISDEGMEGLGSLATGAMQFAQNNPLLGLAIGGAVAFGVYKLLDSGDSNTASKSDKESRNEYNDSEEIKTNHAKLTGKIDLSGTHNKRKSAAHNKPAIFTLQ